MTNAESSIPLSDKVAALRNRLRDGLNHIFGLGNLLNEAVTRSILISPTLDDLGYPATHRLPEYQEKGNTPDETCYLQPLSSAPGEAAIILEAKQYGTDFDRIPPSAPRPGSPDRQIKRYLQQHSASGPNTFGVLTDGIRWRIYQRTGNPDPSDISYLCELNYQLVEDAPQSSLLEPTNTLQQDLAELFDKLGRESIEDRRSRRKLAPKVALAAELFDGIVEDHTPANILRLLLNDPEATVETNLEEIIDLSGIRKDAHDNDWEAYAYSEAIPVMPENPSLFEQHIVFAAVQYRDPLGDVSRADAALCARIFANMSESSTSLVVVYAANSDDNIGVRLAVCSDDRVNMTVNFDPQLPSPSARATIEDLLLTIRSVEDDEKLDPKDLLQPLEVAPLRKKFYREIAHWTGERQMGKDLSERQAILRHLIRVIFAWILKEEAVIPPQLFEQAFVSLNCADISDYHRSVVKFLFHERLNRPLDERDDHDLKAINDAMSSVPFLNGSLFAEHNEDDQIDIPPSEYWGTDLKDPGLFTILSRYHWTMDEHRPGESEQTLDPELLSNLFERLIAPTEKGTRPPRRQPQGTYYTPADIAEEMVRDALAAAVKEFVPASITIDDLLALFGAEDAQFSTLDDSDRDRLVSRIKNLRIFDPAVGSGEFLFGVLVAIQRALSKLEPDAHNPVTDIIERQLSGQDIHPLAVQITRLRLFIAIIAARRGSLTSDEPLPNLEARIVCADSLHTFADSDWRPEHPGQLDSADAELIDALTEVASNRTQWFSAHTESDKQRVLNRDVSLRNNLELLLQNKGELASPELVGFANSPLFSVNPLPAQADARLLFYENPWHGFDIVIGNPPYEALSVSKTKSEIRALSTNWRYRTIKGKPDLYSLFCEASLALANPEGGVVTMIVPLSIAFRLDRAMTRGVFESACREIHLRHYDIRPDTIFNSSPTVATPDNSQRASVITGILGKQPQVTLRTTGLLRWPSSERSAALAQRHTVAIPALGTNINTRIGKQWPRVPTERVSELIRAVISQERTVGSYRYNGDCGVTLAYPDTGRYYIGIIPIRSVTPRSETPFSVQNQDILRLLMATLNGHVGYGWSRVFGDGFHVNLYEVANMTVPQKWVENPQPAIAIGQKLLDAIPNCVTETLNRGTLWRSVNFFDNVPELIEDLDRLHLEALGFTGPTQRSLLADLQVMRSNNSWDFSK